MPADDENLKDEQEDSSSGGKKKTLIYILAGLIGVVILIVAVILITMGVSQKLRDEQVGKAQESIAGERKITEDPLLTHPLSSDPINFNLKPDERGRTRLLQVHIVFAFKDRKVQTELEKRTPQLKDIAVTYFGGKTPDEVSVERLDSVKRELLNSFKRVISGDIETLYFSNYLIVR
jgi:flagellar basal body-associated protein FliL